MRTVQTAVIWNVWQETVSVRSAIKWERKTTRKIEFGEGFSSEHENVLVHYTVCTESSQTHQFCVVLVVFIEIHSPSDDGSLSLNQMFSFSVAGNDDNLKIWPHPVQGHSSVRSVRSDALGKPKAVSVVPPWKFSLPSSVMSKKKENREL